MYQSIKRKEIGLMRRVNAPKKAKKGLTLDSDKRRYIAKSMRKLATYTAMWIILRLKPVIRKKG